MDNVCRIAVTDENRESMLRAVFALSGIKCADNGKILVTDEIPSSLHDVSAVIFITDSSDIPDTGIPMTVIRTPICFDEIIEAVSEICGCTSETSVRREIPRYTPVPEVSEITVRDGCVTYKGKTARLTDQEFALFEYLRARVGKTVTRRELRDALWSEADDGTNVTDVYISYLRRKLKPVFGEGVLLTVRGKGYILSLS